MLGAQPSSLLIRSRPFATGVFHLLRIESGASVSLSSEFPQLRVSDEVFLTRPCDVMSIMCPLLESVFEWGDDVLQTVFPVLSKPRSLSMWVTRA